MTTISGRCTHRFELALHTNWQSAGKVMRAPKLSIFSALPKTAQTSSTRLRVSKTTFFLELPKARFSLFNRMKM